MKNDLHDAQVVIQGAGPVGLACAIWLLKNNPQLGLVILDKNPSDDAFLGHGDARGIAISEGSKQLLKNIDAWVHQAPEIHQVHVSHRGFFGRTIMSKDEIGQAALGHIVRYTDVMQSLRTRLRTFSHFPNFTWLHDVTEAISLSQCGPDSCFIHADGGLFHEQSAKDIRKDYGQSALVGWLDTEHVAPHTAWERFTAEGPIALLPHHAGSLTKNFVWCASTEKIHHLSQLSDADFVRALTEEIHLPIGKISAVHDRRVYPLGLNFKEHIVHNREVWIGNAAQTLHPVAGQGLNLGLRDAYTLATHLNRLFARPHSLPDDLMQTLQHYQKQRHNDRNITIRVTDLMASVFATNLLPIVAARGLGLTMLQWLPLVKNKLARQMMFGQR